MLTLTREAARAIRELTDAPDADGLRIHAGKRFARGNVPAIQVEVAHSPGAEDTVLEAEGARLFVERESLHELDHKVLDADVEGDQVHFAILEQPDEDELG